MTEKRQGQPCKANGKLRKVEALSTYRAEGREEIESLRSDFLAYLKSEGFEFKEAQEFRESSHWMDVNDEKVYGWISSDWGNIALEFKVISHSRLEQAVDKYIAQQPKQEGSEEPVARRE
jgi:hypothetical protein